jgi:hypothetical protein
LAVGSALAGDITNQRSNARGAVVESLDTGGDDDQCLGRRVVVRAERVGHARGNHEQVADTGGDDLVVDQHVECLVEGEEQFVGAGVPVRYRTGGASSQRDPVALLSASSTCPIDGRCSVSGCARTWTRPAVPGTVAVSEIAPGDSRR